MERINNIEQPKAEKPSEDSVRRYGHIAITASLKTMDDFKDSRNNNVVERDKQYLEERQKDFSDKGWLASQFEAIAAHGFVEGKWLGDVPSRTGHIPFMVSPVYTANVNGIGYDDVVNRIDCAVRISDFDGGEQAYMGFDVTLNDDEIRTKLLRTTNDSRKNLPFGFSGLDYSYLEDVTLLARESNVPHYCIAMNIDENTVKTYRHHYDYIKSPDQESLNPKRLQEAKSFLRFFNDKARFIVLSEIFEQNRLALAMLPEHNGRDNRIIDDARAKLQYIDKKIWSALVRAAERCPLQPSIIALASNNTVLSDDDKAILEAKEKREQLLGQIKDCRNSDLPQQEKTRQIRKLRMKLYELVSDIYRRQDPKYQTLISEVKKLRALEREGKAERYKTIQPRNR